MADWRTRAACRGMNTDMFFPERGDGAGVDVAKAVCGTCPVAADCLDEAINLPDGWGEIGIWGGAVVENVVQALARIVVGEQMLAINERYRVALTVHDAAVIVVPEAEREAAMEFIVKKMSIPPAWAKGLPVACEAKWGHSYGEC